jgi:hypothetical protein
MLLAKQYGSKHQQVYESVFKKDEEGGLRTFAEPKTNVAQAGQSTNSLHTLQRQVTSLRDHLGMSQDGAVLIFLEARSAFL